MKARFPICLTAALALVALAAPTAAQRGDDSKRKSKNARTAGMVGGAQVEIEYGRPEVQGRVIWGGLVPYGRIWRTGADEATTVRFDRDVLVEGERLAAGTYALFTIPGEGSWTVVFNRTAKQWGAYSYDAGQDALRVTVTPREHAHVEALEITLAEGAILLRWEKLEVPIGVRAAG
jgi:hypothetical protein